jgi:hypothetical protein
MSPSAFVVAAKRNAPSLYGVNASFYRESLMIAKGHRKYRHGTTRRGSGGVALAL